LIFGGEGGAQAQLFWREKARLRKWIQFIESVDGGRGGGFACHRIPKIKGTAEIDNYAGGATLPETGNDVNATFRERAVVLRKKGRDL